MGRELPAMHASPIAIVAGVSLAMLVSASGSGATRSGGPRSDGLGPAPVRYDRDVRAILSDRCFRCHGPDSGKRQAELRLDVEESATAVRDGRAAIVPGSPEKSELVRRISSTDEDVRMPPPKSGRRPLSSEERETLRRWIEAGAKYEPHWSFVPPVRPDLPEVRDADWGANEVDRFVVAKLESEGLAPSPEAEPEARLRRLFLDLTGLPPTPEEIEKFLAEDRGDRATRDAAWARLVDRLLLEEPYRTRCAERLATPWLDAARYADTCGIHMDAGRQMWLWRDWVLQAYRDGMPFDRFLTEQLAGDLLPDATEAQKIASGFNRNHVTTDEGGAIAEEYLVEYAVDRTATTASVFLGLSMGCARCHDHKFDPVTQEDFYRFYSYFDSIEEPGLYSQLPDPNRAFEPFIEVPTPEQGAELAELGAKLDTEKAALGVPEPLEDEHRREFLAGALERSGVAWEPSRTLAAGSFAGATLTIQPDGSVLASGANPDKDDHTIRLRTDATGLRLLLLEALTDESLPEKRVGRAPNGNAVLSGVTAEAVSVADPTKRAPLRFVWAWADREQKNGDFRAVNVLDTEDTLGWAVDADHQPGGRVLLLLAESPFGFEGGTELSVVLQYRSLYPRHVLGRERLSVGRIGEAGLAMLPAATSSWYLVGPFPADSGKAAFETAFGPENGGGGGKKLDLGRNFGFGNQYWHYDGSLEDDKLNDGLPQGVVATYVGRRVFSPSPRKVEASLGSDDGFRLFLDGAEVTSKEIDRSLAADQDRAGFDVPAGESALVLKDVNTGGRAGFYWKALPREGELAGDLVGALLPPSALPPALADDMVRSWRTMFSPAYRERAQRVAGLERSIADVRAKVPRTMVMKELDKPRDTFVLSRGRYDHPDKSRPVSRGIPAALGSVPDGAPGDRRGLAQWMTSDSNPLVARVCANRVWEMLFGTGIVKTSEDFGMQGDWPSHPELLDWLAVELREKGWDLRGMIRLLVTSRTYRQSSRARPEVRERDPEDRWLAWFPRRRLSAEQLRDQALYVSGLLCEHLGGPSVKPYQPEGLWKEVAMIQSNTREYVLGSGNDLWRRSLYTYWKRACPPPSLLTLDAPTREFCTIRRASTDTPLQELVLWNDEQFVEAARALAERSLLERPGDADDKAVIARMARRCTGRAPEPADLARLVDALSRFRERYRADPAAAYELANAGSAPVAEGLDVAEVAAWTLVASVLLDLDATISRS
jgi:hypothetical protein